MTTLIEFHSGDLKIVADLYEPPSIPAPHVILVHGFGGRRSEDHLKAIATALQEAGIAVVVPDLTRNLGDSEGRFEDLTLSHEVSDVRETIKHVRGRGEVSKLALVGHSLGGLVATLVAGREEGIEAIVLLSAVCDFPNKFRESHEQDLGRWRSEGTIFLDAEKKEKPLGIQFLDDLEVWEVFRLVGEVSVPALILHGSGDEEVPIEHALDYRRLLRGETKLQVIEGADHTYSEETHLKQAVGATVGFLSEKLKA